MRKEREGLGILEETVRLGFLGEIERGLGECEREREREHTCNFRIAESSPGNDVLSLLVCEVFVFHLEVLYFW